MTVIQGAVVPKPTAAVWPKINDKILFTENRVQKDTLLHGQKVRHMKHMKINKSLYPYSNKYTIMYFWFFGKHHHLWAAWPYLKYID